MTANSSEVKVEDEAEKLLLKYRSNRKSLRSAFNQVSENTDILLQKGSELNSEKIDDFFKQNLEESPKEGIEISPKFMTFKNPREGYQCRKRLMIKNTGLKVANIQILQPTSLAYHIEAVETRTILHPGLSLQIWVTYSFRRPSLPKAYLPIKINDDFLYYRLVSVISSAHLLVEPNFLDFEKVDVNFESKSKILTLKNDGEKNTGFTVDVANHNIDIIVSPMEGLIKVGSETKLKVKVVGLKEGTFYSEFWIKSCQNIRVALKVTMIIPKFEVDHPNSIGNSILIDFPQTFLNNLNYETFIVRNLSARNINFLVFGEIDEELVNISEIDECKYPVYSVFKISPIEGAMKPFESKIFTVSFFPTPKAIHPSKEAQDFLTFFKILRLFVSDVKEDIGVISTLSEESLQESSSQSTSMMSGSENSKINEADSDSIILCVHGKVERAQLIFTPDKLYFGDIKVGEKVSRVISISNPSAANTLSFRFVINPNARCTPKEGILKPKKDLQVLIEVKGKIELQSTFNLKFEATAKTFNDCPSTKKESRKVFSYKIKCSLNLLTGSKKELKPKMIRGIDSISETEFCNAIKLPKIKSDFSLIKPLEEAETKRTPDTKSLKSPLSTFELYNIKITPAFLNFGKIASHSIGYKQIQFENRNNFSIMIRLISPMSNQMIFPDENVMILKANGKIAKFVGFYANDESTINGCFNYIINENHSFEMKIMAKIVDKYLKINKTEVLLGKDYLEEAYRPNFTYLEIENELNTDIIFNWKMEAEAGFKIEPLSGLVRGNKKLFVHVSYDPDPFKSNQTKIMMINENTSSINLKLKMNLFPPKVVFLESYIDFGKIPLNITVENLAVLYNSEFSSVTFHVDEDSLIYGIDVYPSHGVIQPRGIKILQITLNFEACLEFTKYISVIVQKSLNLKLKITGQVYFPILKLIPDQLKMKQVSSAARQVHLISAMNQGETKVKLQFLLDKYPEFAISIFPDEKVFFQDKDEIILDPSSSQNLYLHFNPIDPVSYSFNLPILINGIIGPAKLEDPKTSKPMEYLKSKEDKYSTIPGISIMKLPPKLNNICINCTVTHHVISFNNLTFNFDTSLDLIEDEFSILNRAQEESSFIITIDSFQEKDCFFHINWINGKEPTINPVSIVCTLLPKERTTFKINFQPLIEGHFKLEAPIFLKDQLEGNAFNILKLEGNNPKSTIESIDEIYFKPLPLNETGVETFTLIIKNFKSNGKILANILSPERKIGLFTNETIRVDFPEGNTVSKSREREIPVCIQLSNPEPVSFCTKVEFFDNKKISSSFITVYGNVDNSLLTIYPYKLQKYDDLRKSKLKVNSDSKIENKKSVFLNKNEMKINPCNESDTTWLEEINNRNHKTYMKETLTAAEEWLFSNILSFEFYPDVINGITAVVSDVFKKSKNVKFQSSIKKNHSVNYSIFTILELIIGPSFRSYIQIPDSLPENNYERITLLLEKYSEMLQFLCKSKAFLLHVSPIFLLTYNDYLIIEQSNKPQTLNFDKSIKSKKQVFESRSRQCWLDIILQTYKCFKLVEIKENNFIREMKNHENRHFCERILLSWLQYHFEQQSKEEWFQNCKNILSPDEEDKLQSKLINNFDSCLDDGLVFIAITGAYCPFLIKEFFQNIYVCPKRSEEALHNAICVVSAWKKIRLGFLVKPMQIVRPNCVHMLMLITHLHTMLETYLTKTKVQFSCPLTKSITKDITVTNPTENPVNFVTQFFQNELDFFSIIPSQKVLKLNPRQNKKLSIKFEARTFQETKAYLIICGSSIGPNFAPNQTILLEGISNELTIVDEQIITSKMYQILDTLIPIKVPYKNEAIYNISITEDQPKDYSTLKMTLWSEMQKKKVPRRIFINQKCLAVTENAFLANLSITIGSKTPQSKTYWLIFQSEYCDFITKILSTCRPPILQQISIIWTPEFCTCPNPPNEINNNCPLNVKIKISSRNVQLWECIKQMLKKTLTPKEWCFWSRVLDTSFGGKVIQWNLGNQPDSLATEISHLFESCINYNISTSDELKHLSVPDKLSIADVHMPEAETEINVHISQSTPQVYERILKLKSFNGKEIRNYKVKFLRQ